MINTMEKMNILESAAAEACLQRSDMIVDTLAREDGVYEISFHTAWMAYEVYVSADSGEVCGFSAQPRELRSVREQRAA